VVVVRTVGGDIQYVRGFLTSVEVLVLCKRTS
jgi:hypothetical protein